MKSHESPKLDAFPALSPTCPTAQNLPKADKSAYQIRHEATLQPTTQTPHQPEAQAEPSKKLAGNLCTEFELEALS